MKPFPSFGMRLSAISAVVVYALALVSPSNASPADSQLRCARPRIRKEWRSLTNREKAAFLDANECLANLPHTSRLVPNHLSDHLGIIPAVNLSSSIYDDIVFAHMEASSPYHGTGVFMGWHRYYIWTFETYLREECGYRGPFPYWDWTLDYKDLENSSLFDPNPVYGIGSRGKLENNYTLVDGKFKGVIRAYPQPHLIQRILDLTPYQTGTPFGEPYPSPDLLVNTTMTTAAYKRIVRGTRGDFVRFQGALEGVRSIRLEGMHTSVHRAIGGDAASNAPAPNDVPFWFLHTGLDRVWAAWQAEHRDNQWAVGGGMGRPSSAAEFDENPAGVGTQVTLDTSLVMSGLVPGVPARDVMLTDGKLLCYRYDRLDPAGD